MEKKRMSIKTFLNKPYSRTYPKKRWLITILIFSWLILGGLFGALIQNNARAILTIQYEFFDTLPTTATPVINSFMNTYSTDYNKFKVDNTHGSVSDFNSFFYGTDSTTSNNLINFTSSTISYLSFYVNIFLGGAGISYWYFNSSETNLFNLKIQCFANNSALISDGTTGLPIFWKVSSYYKYNFSFTPTQCTFTYENYSGFIYSAERSGSITFSISNNFNKIRFKTNTVGGGASYGFIFDNFIIGTDEATIPTINTFCGYDMSLFLQRGTLTPHLYYEINSPDIYENFVLPLSTTIGGITLIVNGAQYLDDSNINNYSLSLNNVVIGIPNCFEQSFTGQYVLFWKTNTPLSNQTLSLKFTHTKQTHNRYWLVGGGDYNEDLDNDGDTASGSNNFLYQECRWIVISGIPYYICTDVYSSNQQYDLAYSFYYTQPFTQNPYNYTDTLGLSGYSYKNTTGYVYNLADLNDIICSYTLNDPSYSYTIQVTHNGTDFLEQHFPKLCNYPSGTVSLSPTLTGEYNFSLVKSSIVYTVKAWVIGTLPDTYIKTSPSITNQYETYNVIYKFTHLQGFNGAFALFDSFSKVNTYGSKSIGVEIDNNVSGIYPYASVSSITEYWRVFVNRGNSYFPIGNIATHYIAISGLVDNTITFSPQTLKIVNNNQNNVSIYISGQHTFIGCDVGIYINGIFFKSVKNDQNYYAFYSPNNIGIYTIDLRIIQNGTLLILATSPYVLTVTEDTSIPIENPLDTLGIPIIFRIPLGIGLAMLFLCIPLFVQYKAHIDINIFVYLFFGIFGLIISTVIGLSPVIILGIILLILVLIIVIQWLQRKMI